jgi:hypothetical protein
MRPYTNQVLLLLLNRLQSKPSALFTQAFVYFMALLSAVESVGPDFVIQSLDAIQPGYVFGWVATHCLQSGYSVIS